jgi:hypothetical protein
VGVLLKANPRFFFQMSFFDQCLIFHKFEGKYSILSIFLTKVIWDCNLQVSLKLLSRSL